MAHATLLRPAGSALFTVLALSTVLALTGCGRKGPLELPPGTPPDPVTRGLGATRLTSPQAAPPTKAADVTQPGIPGPVADDPSLIQPPNKSYQVPASTQLNQVLASPAAPPINRPPGPKPGKTFVLDPLL